MGADDKELSRELVFEVKVPDPALGGLTSTISVLEQLKAAMDAINESFSSGGLPRSAAEIESALHKAFGGESVKGQPISEALGKIRGDLKLTEREVTRTLAALEKLGTAPVKDGRFTAHRGVSESISQAISAQIPSYNELLKTLFAGGGGAKVSAKLVESAVAGIPGGAVKAELAGAERVRLAIPTDRVLAQLLPEGTITLLVPSERIRTGAASEPVAGAPAGAAPSAAGSSAPVRRGKGKGVAVSGAGGGGGDSGDEPIDLAADGLVAEPALPPGYETLIARRVLRTQKAATQFVTHLDSDLRKVTDTLGAEGLSRQTIAHPLRVDAIADFRKRLTQAATRETGTLTADLSGSGGKASAMSLARSAHWSRMATQYETITAAEQDTAEKMGYTAVLAKTQQGIARMRQREETELAKAVRQEVTEREQAAVAEKAAIKARFLTPQEAEQQRQEAVRVHEQGAKVLAAGQRNAEQARLEMEARRSEQMAEQQAKVYGQTTVTAAEDRMTTLLANGYLQKSARRKLVGGRGTESLVLEKEFRGQKLREQFDFVSEGGARASASITDLTRALKATRAESGAAGSNFVANTQKVTAWTASVFLLYGTLGAAKAAVSSFVDTSYQIARLGVVYNSARGDVGALADDVLKLAAVQGRSAKEGLDSAIGWSRILKDRREITEAVRVSLQAANVAEVDAATATENLQAIYQSYGRNVGALTGTLAQMNEISNTTNATVGNLFEGLSRVAEVAAEARIPLGELNGIMGAMIAQTKQPGAAIGNALKTIVGRLSSPEKLNELRDTFSIDVTQGGQYREFLGVLDQVFLAQTKMSDAERRALLGRVAGNTQLTRASALLDTYIRAQSLAVRTQLALNSAENENAVIRATTKSQLAGLTVELERMVSLQGNNGPGQMLGGVVETLKNVVHLLNLPGVNQVLGGTAALLGVLAVRTLVLRARLDSLRGTPGFMGRTWSEAREISGAFFNSVFSQLRAMRRAFSVSFTGRRMLGGYVPAGGFGALSTAGNALNGVINALTLLGRRLVIPAALIAGFSVFNQVMEAFGQSTGSAGEKVDGFEAAATRAAGRVEAMREAVHVLDLAMSALPNTTGEATRSMLRDLDNLPDALRPTVAEIQAIVAEPGTAPRVLAGNRADALLQQHIALAAQKRAEASAIAAQQVVVGKLEAAPKSTRDEKLLGEQRGRLDDLRARFLKTAVTQMTGEAVIDPKSGRTLAEMAKDEVAVLHERRDVLKSILDLTKLEDPVDELRRRIALQTVYVDLLRQESAATEAGRAQASVDGSAQEKAASEARLAANKAYAAVPPETISQETRSGGGAFLDAANAALENTRHHPVANLGFMHPLSPVGLVLQGVNFIRDQFAGGEAPGDAARHSQLGVASALGDRADKMEATTKMSGADRFNARVTALKNEVREAEAQLARDRAIPVEDAHLARKLQGVQRHAANDASAYDVGDTETERALSRQAGLQKLSGKANSQLNDTAAPEQDRLAAAVRFFEYERQLRETNLELQKRQTAATAEEVNLLREKTKEFQKNLILSTPQDLLKRLAALQITGNGSKKVSAGEFLAAGDLRQYIVEQPGYGFEEAKLKRDRALLAGVKDLPDDDARLDGNRSVQARLLGRAFTPAGMNGYLNGGNNLMGGGDMAGQMKVLGGAFDGLSVQALMLLEALRGVSQKMMDWNPGIRGGPRVSAASGIPGGVPAGL